MPLSFKFNLTWITFNLIALWCLLAHEQFTILLLIHPFASKAPSLPGASPKYWAVGISCPTGWPAKPTELQCLGWVLGFFFWWFSSSPSDIHTMWALQPQLKRIASTSPHLPPCSVSPSTIWDEEKPMLPHPPPTQFPHLLPSERPFTPSITQPLPLLCSPCPALSLLHSCHQCKIN